MFFGIPLLGMAYVMWHVWCIFPTSVWVKILSMVGMIGLFMLLFVGIGRSLDTLSMSLATVIYEVSTSWLIILLYLFLVFLLLDIGRLFHIVPKQWLFGSWKGLLGIVAFLSVVLHYGNTAVVAAYGEDAAKACPPAVDERPASRLSQPAAGVSPLGGYDQSGESRPDPDCRRYHRPQSAPLAGAADVGGVSPSESPGDCLFG